LPDFGIEPIVYIPENPTYPILDNNLESQVSKDVIVLRKKIIEPYRWASIFSRKQTQKISSGIISSKKKQTFIEKILLWLRGNLFIPDARVLWVKPSVKYLEKYLQENNIDTIITTGPPHSMHLIGLKLKAKLNINWIADFRDPWTTIGYHKELLLSNSSIKKHKELESKVLNSADKIIVTSSLTKLEFQDITTKPIEVITNGYDVENVEKQKLDSKFTLAHIGSLLSNRNPEVLWNALSKIIQENQTFKEDFELKLIGKVSQEVLSTLEKYNLSSYINNLGYISHKEAIEHQKKSQVLLLIEIDSVDTKAIIPGKIFEYLVSDRPILAIGPEGSDFKNIILSTNTGVFFNYSENQKLKELILQYYFLFKEDNLKVYPIGLQQYSRKNLTQQLAQFINT